MTKKDKWIARVAGTVKVDPSQDVVVERQQLQGADFSGRRLLSFAAIGSRFEECRFDNTIIESAHFGGGREAEVSEYIGCSFDGLRTSSKIGGFERFVRCSFLNVDLREWFCFSTEMVDCTFSGRLRGCVFNGHNPHQIQQPSGFARLRRRGKLPTPTARANEFHGNDFSDAKLIDTAFRTGIDLIRQKLPTGSDYLYVADAAGKLDLARADVSRWEDSARKTEALTLLTSLSFESQGGQQQLFFEPATYRRLYSTDVTDPIFALLRES